jgi:hypothetical protein
MRTLPSLSYISSAVSSGSEYLCYILLPTLRLSSSLLTPTELLYCLVSGQRQGQSYVDHTPRSQNQTILRAGNAHGLEASAEAPYRDLCDCCTRADKIWVLQDYRPPMTEQLENLCNFWSLLRTKIAPKDQHPRAYWHYPQLE